MALLMNLGFAGGGTVGEELSTYPQYQINILCGCLLGGLQILLEKRLKNG